MKKLCSRLLAGLTVVTAVAAQIPPAEFVQRNDRNGDGKLSREEIPDWAKGRFEAIDLNQDGFVTVDEMRQFTARQNVAAIKFLFGLPESFNWDADAVSPELDAKLKDAAPITHLTKDDPPVYGVNNKAADVPGNIHHANFGRHLKQLMDGLGVECVFHLDTDFATYQAGLDDKMAFFRKHLGVR